MVRIPPRPPPAVPLNSTPGPTAAPAAAKVATVAPVGTPTTAQDAVALAGRFYQAFAARDADGMEACYAPNVVFHDPLFGHLNGPQAMEMWRAIIPAADPKTFQVSPTVDGAPVQQRDGSFKVKVHWDAHYDLPGRTHVDNRADTTLVIKDGRIVSQRDEWDLSNWTRQALPVGGGTALGNGLARLAAHGAIEVKDFLAMFRR